MIRKKVDDLLEKILVVLMGVMVLDVLWQVASRYLFMSPSVFTDELAGFLLIWVGLLGAAYASGKGQHLAIDILPNKLNHSNKLKLDIFINLCVAVFAVCVMIIGGSNLVYLTFLLKQKSASLGIPLGYIYSCIPLSGALILFYATLNIYEKLTTKQASPGGLY